MIDPFARGPRSAVIFEPGDIVILCEGRDECAVIRQLTAGWPHTPKILTRDASAGLTWEDEFKALAGQVAMHVLSGIGFVFDAEPSRGQAERELKKRHDAAGLKMPRRPGKPEKSVVDGVEVWTAYFLNPPGRAQGGLESLFLPQIRKSPRWACIDALMRCYKKREPIKQSPDKVILRTFIAHSNPYNTGLAVAFHKEKGKSILTCDCSEFDPLRAFLSALQAKAARHT
jgi:hypothetical protein